MLFKNLLLGATLVTSAAAFPSMREGGSAPALEKKGCPFGFDKVMKRDDESAEEFEERQVLGLGSDEGLLGLGLGETVGNALTGAGGLLEGLLGSIAQLNDGETKVPDAAHPFQSPEPSDQRGPCPGLNAMANHGCECSLLQVTLFVAHHQTSLEAVSSLLVKSFRALPRHSTWEPICLPF
jgi:hypothetical protein